MVAVVYVSNTNTTYEEYEQLYRSSLVFCLS